MRYLVGRHVTDHVIAYGDRQGPRNGGDPLTPTDFLGSIYRELGVAVDQLPYTRQLGEIVHEYNTTFDDGETEATIVSPFDEFTKERPIAQIDQLQESDAPPTIMKNFLARIK